MRAYQSTAAYKKAIAKRKVWVEPLFAEGKDWHGMERFRLRMLEKVNIEGLLIAAGQNLKRLLSWRGWGRRWWPGGAQGVVLPTVFGSFLDTNIDFQLSRRQAKYGSGAVDTPPAIVISVFQQVASFLRQPSVGTNSSILHVRLRILIEQWVRKEIVLYAHRL